MISFKFLLTVICCYYSFFTMGQLLQHEYHLSAPQFESVPLEGDFLLTGFFELGNVDQSEDKIGWRLTVENQVWAEAILNQAGKNQLIWGSTPETRQIQTAVKTDFSILQLERAGNQLIMRGAHIGEPLQEIASTIIENLPYNLIGGVFIEGNSNTSGHVWNLRVDLPVGKSYNAYQSGLLTARLEWLDINSLNRQIIYTDEIGFEAPNWLENNDLIFNQKGLIFKINPNSGKTIQIETGNVVQNNNDHVVSWSGKELAISSSSEGFSSRIYRLPITGGVPQLVTPNAPSYLHGWSNDERYLVYTAQRNNEDYNLFRIEINTQKEEQLTFNKGLTDGPEYSPDGKYIYYNGTQSGTMQIWRMNTDGSDPEQLTFDAQNDWFPHISPDNQWIVFVSFPTSVSPLDHPHYQRIEIRIMPVAGGAPRTLAYVYGGQGTMNVPSWSPDSKKIAFVSYQGRIN